jgi:succinate-semialdehyde dehydrogenase/glutarate-semialdehyde dehydrogenase
MTRYPELNLLIDGQWRTRPGDLAIVNPMDETVLGHLPHATRSDLDDALAAAERGFGVWRRTAPAARSAIMAKATQIVRCRVDDIAMVMTLEQGKPIAQARTEIMRACDIIDWDAGEARRAYGRIIPAEPSMHLSVVREPIGVVAAFTPWNFPVSSPARKIGGALAAGCSIILKPSEETPAGAFMLAQAFVEAGLPPGVINLVYGNPSEISEHLISHPIVRLATFTGSVPVGKHLASLAGQHMKPVIMELGGHAPVIVCDDADPVAAAKASVIGKSRNAGQVCVSPTRFFVHDGIYDAFVTEFGRGAAALKVGNGLDPQTDIGPLANSRRIEAMQTLIADAVGKGARVVSGGERIGNRGYQFPITVLADVPDGARAMREEPFGPVALVSRVASVDEAISKANALPYGLAAYAFTRSAAHVAALSGRIECGNLAINHFTPSLAETPFGGVKDSGFGREGGTEGVDSYMVSKHISLKLDA